MTVSRGGVLSVVVFALVAIGVAEAQVTVQFGGPRAQPPLLTQFVTNGGAPFRFHIVGGRLSLRGSVNFGAFDRNQDAPGLKEVFRLRIEKGQPSLTYERTAGEEQLTIKASGSEVSIVRLPVGKSALVPVEYQQMPDKQITLTVGSGDRRQIFRAADLWRLLIAYPEQCRQYLFPLLVLLRPDWKLAEMAAGVEQTLLDDARADTASEHARWAALVKQLGDEQFAKREAADRTLREGKTAALNYLRKLDFNRLDAEQQFRVHGIVEALTGVHEDDSPAEAATSMAGDPKVWLALLSRPDAAVRRTAAAQLAALLHEPITIDPAAEPDTQKAQREQLRVRIEGK